MGGMDAVWCFLRGGRLTILRYLQRLLRVYVPHLGDFEGGSKVKVRSGVSEVDFVDIEILGVVEFPAGLECVRLGKRGEARQFWDEDRNISTTSEPPTPIFLSTLRNEGCQFVIPNYGESKAEY